MKRLVLSILFMSLFSSAIYAQGYFHKIKGCVVYYGEISSISGDSTGSGILLLNNINEMIIKSNGVSLIFGKNSTSLYANKSEVQQIVNATLKCSK